MSFVFPKGDQINSRHWIQIQGSQHVVKRSHQNVEIPWKTGQVIICEKVCLTNVSFLKITTKKKNEGWNFCLHVSVLWRNVKHQNGKISWPIFTILFRAVGPLGAWKDKSVCMWLLWKKLFRSFIFTKDFPSFLKWRQEKVNLPVN